MADVCHVYGVAELLRTLWREVDRDAEPDIHITDLGPLWLVEAPDVDADETVAEGVAEALTAPVFAPEERPEDGEPPPEWFISQGWNYLNITNRTGKDKKADTLRAILAALVPNILDAAGEGPLSVTDTYGSGKETIPQGLESAAAKGSRSASRASYAEGGVQTPVEYWALSCVGAMAVGRFLWALHGPGDTSIVPVPADISYTTNLEIRDLLRTKGRLCTTSTTAALAHYAVRLSHAAITRMGRGGTSPPAYSGIVYESMSRTGQQPKPAHGGLFPMEYLNAIATDDPAQALALCEVWDKVLTQGSFQGREMLALTLAEFLMHPSLSRLERHWRVHLRFSLRDKTDSKRVGVSYDEGAMKGLMEHVRA